MTRRPLYAFGCIVIGMAISNAIYRADVVPRLPSWHAIPLSWYPAILIPLAVGYLGAGLMVRSLTQIAAVALLTACLSFLPGGHDTDVALDFVLGFMLTMLVLGLVFAVAEQFRRRVAPT